jgi:ABC-2 type transport system permease protein
MFRAYKKLASIALQQTIAYRAGFFLGLLGPMFFLLAMLYLWNTLLRHGAKAGFDAHQMRAYLVVAFVCGNLVSMWTDFSISNKIRDGSIALDLAKPIDYQRARLSETLGVGVFELGSAALVGTVAILVLWLAGDPAEAPTTSSALLFVLSLMLVVPLKFCISYITGLACFWTQNYFGVSMARQAVTNLMSGALAPLVFFPHWFQTLAAWLPFQAIASTPALIFLGKKSGTAAWEAIGLQALWVVAMLVISRAIFNLALRKLTVHGG